MTDAPKRRTINIQGQIHSFTEGDDILREVHERIANAYFDRYDMDHFVDEVVAALDRMAVWRYMRGDDIHELRNASRYHDCPLPLTEEEILAGNVGLAKDGLRLDVRIDPGTGDESFRFLPLEGNDD